MIVWLASYPRSGNTLLRTMLAQSFGLPTHSLYDDAFDIAKNPDLAARVRHVSHGLSDEAFYTKARHSTGLFLIKTHQPPLDDAKAIYVVRDGRSAAVSYFHYIRDFAPFLDISMEDIVLGACIFGAWSDHYEKWQPDTRANILVLRYEDLVATPGRALAGVSRFIDRPILDRQIPAFEDLQSVDPHFFRAGSDARNIAELTGEALDLFWLLHGPLMTRLGYVDDSGAASRSMGRKLRERLARLQDDIASLETERLRLEGERIDLERTMHVIQRTRWWRLGQTLRLAGETPAACDSRTSL